MVVRGHTQRLDPTYCGVSHDGERKRYVMVEVRDGSVVDRTILPHTERRKVETAMQDFHFRGGDVYMDVRTDRGLLPLTRPSFAQRLDSDELVRAKSDEELVALERLSRDTYKRLYDRNDTTERAFRGAAASPQHASVFRHRRAKGFDEYRGGYRDALGRCSDLTRVEARTPEWSARLDRTYRGLQAVQSMVRPGVAVEDLNRAFLSHMDADRDVVYGDVVHGTGWGSHESHALERLRDYDFVTIGAAVGDHKETAVVYRSTRAVRPLPAPPPEPRASSFRNAETPSYADAPSQVHRRAFQHFENTISSAAKRREQIERFRGMSEEEVRILLPNV